jgi:hypothetical protein
METRVERDERNIPIKAVCSVWRKDRSHPVICEAYFNEYQKQSDVWKKYPSAMIAKVAEVLALKRSFSINGVVTEDEIGNDEERGSKEAQKAYLADKGLTPYEREKKQLPPATKPEVIRELDNMLNAPTQAEVDSAEPMGGWQGATGTRGLEMRHAVEVAEANAALKEVKKPVEKQRKTGAVTFDVLKHFGEIKKLLNEATGSDEAYYATLKAYSYQKSNEIKDNDQAREIYKALAGLHKRAQEDKKLRTELELAHMQYGVDFVDLLGVHACTSIDDVLLLSSDPLQALLAEIKDLGQRS